MICLPMNAATDRSRRPVSRARGALLALLAALLAGTALAAPTPGTHPALQACHADAEKLCPKDRPGDGQLLGCLQQQSQALTPACRDALPALSACRDEARKLCGEGAAGARRACLRQHRAELAHCAGATH